MISVADERKIVAAAISTVFTLLTIGLWIAGSLLNAQGVDRKNHITIHRTFSDIDGREMAVPAVYVVENGKESRHDGHVIARELPSGEWLIRVGGKEFKTRDKRESVTYFDLGPSPDNPGAIRS